MLGLSTVSEPSEEESYFWAISKLSPENQREVLNLIIVKLELKQAQTPSEGRAMELEILNELVELPLEEMAEAISSINSKEQSK